jgi:hypothetical protein
MIRKTHAGESTSQRVKKSIGKPTQYFTLPLPKIIVHDCARYTVLCTGEEALHDPIISTKVKTMNAQHEVSRRKLLSTAIAGGLTTFGFGSSLYAKPCSKPSNQTAYPSASEIFQVNGKNTIWEGGMTQLIGCTTDYMYQLKPQVIATVKTGAKSDEFAVTAGFKVIASSGKKKLPDQWIQYTKVTLTKEKDNGFVIKIYNNTNRLIKTFTQGEILNPFTHQKPYSYSNKSNKAGFMDELRWRKRSLNDVPWNDNDLAQRDVNRRRQDAVTLMIHNWFQSLRNAGRFSGIGATGAETGFTPFYDPRFANYAYVNPLNFNRIEFSEPLGNAPSDYIYAEFYVDPAATGRRHVPADERHQGIIPFMYELYAIRDITQDANSHQYRVLITVREEQFQRGPRGQARSINVSRTRHVRGIFFDTDTFNGFLGAIDDLRDAQVRFREAIRNDYQSLLDAHRFMQETGVLATAGYLPGHQRDFAYPDAIGSMPPEGFNLEAFRAMPLLFNVGASVALVNNDERQALTRQAMQRLSRQLPSQEVRDAGMGYVHQLGSLNILINIRIGSRSNYPFDTQYYYDGDAGHRRLLGYTHDVVQQKVKKPSISVNPGVSCRLCPEKNDVFEPDAPNT